MGLAISFHELNEILEEVQLQSRRIRHELRDASTALMAIHGSDILSGRVKEAMNLVILNQHIPILQGLYEAYRMLEQELRRMIDQARAHLNEVSENGIIMESSIDNISGGGFGFQGLSQYARAQAEFEQEFRDIYRSIEDYIPMSMPSNETYEEQVEDLSLTLREVNARLHDFRFDTGLFRDFISQINTEINHLEATVDLPFSDDGRMAISGRLEFASAMEVLNVAATQAKWERVNILLKDWYGQDPAEIFANLKRPLSEYEAWAWKIFSGGSDDFTPAERMAIGRDQRNNGIFMIAAGAVLIVLTGGKAAPLIALTWGASKTVVIVGTVAGYTLGGASIAFGTAEALEGHDNMRLAQQGDIFTPSSNFLRDTVFNGNQELYEVFRNDVSAATMIANLTLISIPRMPHQGSARPQFNKNSDPLRDALGPGRESHPELWSKTLNDMKARGVEVKFRKGALAYSSALTPGKPGQLIIDPNASIGALLHEYQHFLDDAALNFPGMSVLFQTQNKIRMELNGYMREIHFAESLGLKDTANQLTQNYIIERNNAMRYLWERNGLWDYITEITSPFSR